MTTAACVLCQQTIAGYRPDLHHLVIEDAAAVDICDRCAGAFAVWHGARMARLFPTKAMKRWTARKKTSQAKGGPPKE